MIITTGTYHLNPLGYFFLGHTYEIMVPIFLLLVFMVLINLKTITNTFSKISKRTWLILVLIILAGFWLRNSDYIYGVGMDGYLYQESAKSIYENNLFTKGCAIGNSENCRLYNQVLMPQGHPFLITLMFHLFGEQDLLAMYLSGVLGSLTIFLVFGMAYLIFSSEKTALVSSMIYAFIPLDIFLCSTAAVRPVSNFFIALSIISFILGLRKNSTKIWSMFAVIFSYTIYVRQENIILFFPFLFLFLWEKRREINLSGIKKNLKILSLPMTIFLIALLPFFHWFIFSDINYGGGIPTFSLDYFGRNSSYMIDNFLFPSLLNESYFFIPWISVFFFISLPLVIFYFRKNKKIKNAFLWLVFLAFFSISALYFDPVFNSIRRMQPLFIPYSILSSVSILFFVDKIKKIRRYSTAILFLAIIISAIMVGINLKPYIFKDNRMEEFYTKEIVTAVNSTPENSLLFISQPSVPNFDFFEDGRRWIDINLIFADNYTHVYEELEYSTERPVYFIEDTACTRHYQENKKNCDFIYSNFELVNHTEFNGIKVYNLKRTGRV
ncbi:MAG: glycosyltransferase family 39 protein [archaeon]|nr:MAG: glycosyltransferase family 39 protein [archaeon]